MRKLYPHQLLLLFWLVACVAAEGQPVIGGRDKYTLLTMPYNMRQLTLYRGQFKTSAGYKFAVRSHRFDNEGNNILLRKSGTGSVFHYYFADIRYGILDFLEIGAETNFIRHGIRSEAVTYSTVSLTLAERVTVNQIKEIRGPGDIFLNATASLPLRYKWFDMSIRGGIYIPSAEYKQEKPEHQITNILSADSYTVNYKYNYTNGFGVPVYLLSSQVKFTFRQYSMQAGLSFRTPAKEGTSIRWEETLVERKFVYYDESYKYLLSDAWIADVAFHYQATGWFDIFMNIDWQKTTGGWTEFWGNKYSNRESRYLALEPGFELQVSPALTVCQTATFPLAGKNSDAPFCLFTTIRFSTFPFLR